jgi:uncharacterized protein involved in exopolysaccharide biosynthesis
VNGLRSEVARLESKVNEASATLGSNHPKMQQLQAELGAMRSRLGAESSRAGQAAAATAESNARRLRDLEGQIAAQKTRVLASSRERGSLSVLQQEVQSAQKAYETVAASAAQARLQSMTTQGNVQMLGSASEPVEPSGPTAPQVLAIALAGGLLLGLATALLAELANRRVRSVEDLETATHLPIIGVVPELGRRRALDALEFAQGPRRLTLYPQGRPA